MSEKFLNSLSLPNENLVLQNLDNGYFNARLIEISSLLTHLLETGLLDRGNLKGPIIDLGTGSGIALLAFRKFTTAYLVGVDESTSLITCFYSIDNNQDVINTVGKILKPGGQFIYTADNARYKPKTPEWSSKVTTITGSEGPYQKTLVLPLPDWVKNRYSHCLKSSRFFLEKEIFDTDSAQVGLIRDREVYLFTK